MYNVTEAVSRRFSLCQTLFLNKVAGLRPNFIKKETLAQVFSCEFCKISKNTFFYRTLPVATSGDCFFFSTFSTFKCCIFFSDWVGIKYTYCYRIPKGTFIWFFKLKRNELNSISRSNIRFEDQITISR